MSTRLKGVAVALTLAFCGANAYATDTNIKFYNPSANLPNSVVGSGACTAPDKCGTALVWNDVLGSTDLTATASFRPPGGVREVAPVIQDLSPTFGGLGVLDPAALDNIGAGERLTLTFSAPVVITRLVFWNEAHTASFTGQRAGTFTLGVDGNANFLTTALTNQYDFATPVAGTVFSFSGNFSGSLPGFYVGGVNVTPVPEPSAMAMVGLGVIGVGLALRRRRENLVTPKA
jgi:hypothetical protein